MDPLRRQTPQGHTLLQPGWAFYNLDVDADGNYYNIRYNRLPPIPTHEKI